jgi:hypothetical protein
VESGPDLQCLSEPAQVDEMSTLIKPPCIYNEKKINVNIIIVYDIHSKCSFR